MDPHEAPTQGPLPGNASLPVPEARRIGSVRLEELLGVGGMGAVWRGFDEKLGRAVAVKAVHGEPADHAGTRERFRREARLLSQLNHPGICHVYDLVEHEGRDYLVLELVEGRTLRAALARALPRAEALRVAREVAEALAAAHEHGIVHSDLKPENVMLDAHGRVKVLDFGIARLAGQAEGGAGEPGAPREPGDDAALTRRGGLLGTPGYMSPEQAAEQPSSPASDGFALGLLLQELLTGRPAYPRLPWAELRERLVRGATEPIDGLPAGVVQLVRSLQAARPEARPTAAEAARRLARLAEEPARRRARAVAGVTALGLAALASVSVWQWRQLREVAGSREPLRVLVLPLQASGSDELLGRGLGNEVAGRLRRLQALRILSAGAPGAPLPSGSPLELAREVSADVVVSGRATRAPSGELLVEATVQRVGELRPLWQARYERTAAALAALEGQLARDVATALRVPIPPEQAAVFGAVPTANVEAYQAYLRARGSPFLLNHSPDRYEVPIRLLDRAVALDPGFVQAHLELANLHSATYMQGIDRSPRRAELARRHAALGAELAPGLPEVLLARGYVAYRLDHDLEAALAIFRSASEQLPSSGEARQAVAYVERRQGRVAEALAALQEAQSLSPQDPVLALEVAHTLFVLRRHEAARAEYDRSIALAPDQTSAYLFAAWNAWARGRRDEGRAVLERIPDLDQPFGLYFRYQQALFDGRWDEALATIERVREPSVDWQLWAYPVALLRGFALEAAGREAEARAAYEEARALSERRSREQPTDPRHVAALALARASLGDGSGAELAARRAVALYPMAQDRLFSPFFRKELAWTLARAGRPAEAERELAAVLALPGWVTREEVALDPRWRATRLRRAR